MYASYHVRVATGFKGRMREENRTRQGVEHESETGSFTSVTLVIRIGSDGSIIVGGGLTHIV